MWVTDKQVIEVIWHEAASPQQMGGSVVFPRWRRIWLNLCFLQRTQVYNQMANRSVQPFLHSRKSSCFTVGAAFPQNFPFPWTPSNTWFLGPPESSIQMASGSVQSFLQDSLVWPTDRQTDRPRYSVGNNRPHLRRSTAMRPKKQSVATNSSLDYHVWGAVLEKYHKLQPKPKTIDELKTDLQTTGKSCHKTTSTRRWQTSSTWLPTQLPMIATSTICSKGLFISKSASSSQHQKPALVRATHIITGETMFEMLKTRNNFSKLVQQHYVGEVGKSITFMLYIILILCAK